MRLGRRAFLMVSLLSSGKTAPNRRAGFCADADLVNRTTLEISALTQAEVSLRKVVKDYGTTPVVRAVDLEIADEEFVVLAGPSGCGKSSTLRMIGGLEDITDGEIWIGGKLINGGRRAIGTSQ